MLLGETLNASFGWLNWDLAMCNLVFFSVSYTVWILGFFICIDVFVRWDCITSIMNMMIIIYFVVCFRCAINMV